MANFHPKPHQNTVGQLYQSLEQLKHSLATSGDYSANQSEASGPATDHSPDFDWEAALASAAADIDNYFKD